MSPYCIKSKHIVTPESILDACIVIDGGIITTVAGIDEHTYDSLPVMDVGDSYVAPGFIDLHVHGGGGYDFMDGTPESMMEASKFHLAHGTTSLLPTTLTSSDEELHNSIRIFHVFPALLTFK